jgi:hypothetical protein
VELSGTIQQSGRAYAVTPPLTARVGASEEERKGMVSRRTSTMHFIGPMGWFGSHHEDEPVYCAMFEY